MSEISRPLLAGHRLYEVERRKNPLHIAKEQ